MRIYFEKHDDCYYLLSSDSAANAAILYTVYLSGSPIKQRLDYPNCMHLLPIRPALVTSEYGPLGRALWA